MQQAQNCLIHSDKNKLIKQVLLIIFFSRCVRHFYFNEKIKQQNKSSEKNNRI